MKLQLCPIGYPVRIQDVAELKKAIREVLTGLSFLHERGFVHREIRWENVVKDVNGSFVLIDLENAGHEGPVTYNSLAWPPAPKLGEFIKAMDMMVGLLIDTYQNLGLDEDGHVLVSYLHTSRSNPASLAQRRVGVGVLFPGILVLEVKITPMNSESLIEICQ